VIRTGFVVAILALVCALPTEGTEALEVQGLPERLWGGDTAEVTVRLKGEPAQALLRLAWTLTWGGRILRGEIAGVRPGAEHRVSVQLPEVRARVNVSFHVQAFEGTRQVAELTRRLELFPAGLFAQYAAAHPDRSVGLVVRGEPGKRLQEAVPLRWQVLESPLAVRAFKGAFIVLWSEEAFPGLSAWPDALLERVRAGTKVACLGGISTLRRNKPRSALQVHASEARPLAPGHPLLADLREGDLARWAPDGLVGSTVLEAPEDGNYLMLVDLPSDAGPRPLALEQRVGAGRVLYCALPLAERLRQEPVAELMFVNLLRWGSVEHVPPRPALCLFPGDSPAGKLLRQIGACDHESVHAPPHVTIADAGLLLKENREALAKTLKEGGTVLLMCLSREDLPRLNEVLRERWGRDLHAAVPEVTLEPGRATEDTMAWGNPLLAGVRPEDARALVRAAGEVALAAQPVSDAEHFVSLINGLVAKYERDGVQIVFWQAPVQGECAEPAGRILTALLTNLGIKLGTND